MEGEPVQVIASAYHSVRGGSTALPDAERKAEEQRLTTEEATLPFDLAHRPLRAQLLHLSPEEYMLLFTMHRR